MKPVTYKYLILMVCFITFISCKNEENKDHNKPLKINNKNIISEVYNQLGHPCKSQFVLLVPRNSCESCRKFIYSKYNSLTKLRDLEIIYLTQGDTALKPIEIKDVRCVSIEPIERKYELYGITLFEIRGDTIFNKTEINPTNAQLVISNLLKRH